MELSSERPRDGLWVDLEGFGRCLILGNSHTHPGHFEVRWCETGQSISASLSWVNEASEEAILWLEGFLAGNAPSLERYLGLIRLVEDRHTTQEETHRWHRALTRFRATGDIPPMNRRPVKPVDTRELSTQPDHIWSTSAGLVYVWNGSSWIEDGDVESFHDRYLVPECEAGHDIEDCWDYLICARCGHATSLGD